MFRFRRRATGVACRKAFSHLFNILTAQFRVFPSTTIFPSRSSAKMKVLCQRHYRNLSITGRERVTWREEEQGRKFDRVLSCCRAIPAGKAVVVVTTLPSVFYDPCCQGGSLGLVFQFMGPVGNDHIPVNFTCPRDAIRLFFVRPFALCAPAGTVRSFFIPS